MPSPKPLIKLATKLGAKIEAKPLSSTMRRLAGTAYKHPTWEESKIIKGIHKEGTNRWFTFTDGTAMPTSIGELHMRAQIVGSGVEIGELEGAAREVVLQRARTALARNAKMMESGALNEFWPRRLTKSKHEQFLKYINETNIEAVPYVLVESIDGRIVPLPEMYARELERVGEARILRRGKRGK